MRIKTSKLVSLLLGKAESPFYQTTIPFVITCLQYIDDKIGNLIASELAVGKTLFEFLTVYIEDKEISKPSEIDTLINYILNPDNNKLFCKNQNELIEFIENHIFICKTKINNNIIKVVESDKYLPLTANIHPEFQTIFRSGLKDSKLKSVYINNAIQLINEKLRDISSLLGKNNLSEVECIKLIFTVENNPFSHDFLKNNETSTNKLEGFEQIFLGVFKGIRNPTSHSLVKYLDDEFIETMFMLSLLNHKLDQIMKKSK